MPTLRDVATLAGVSTATVSHVVNNSRRITPETRARVERAIAEIGFVPNPVGRLLAQQKSGAGVSLSDLSKAMGNHAETHTETGEEEEVVGAVAGGAQSSGLAGGRDAGGAGAAVSSNTAHMLLKIVRAAQPISRAELARRLKVNRSTVTEIVRPLLSAGVLREGGTDHTGTSRVGRPPTDILLDAGRSFFIGVNIGVRQSQIGAATVQSEMLGEESFDTPSEPAAALALVRAGIERLCARVTDREVRLIGVSVPGPTDAERRRLLYAPHLGWKDVEIEKPLSTVQCGGKRAGRMNGVPVIVENDATAAAMYEARRRLRDSAYSSWSDFILVRAGTGIGVGLVMDGDVYRGTGVGDGIAGEFGHMTIVAGGKQCSCGNRGCWERYASASAASALYMGDRIQVGGATAPRFVEIVARAEAGERRATATLERVGEYLGIGIGNVITGLGVPRVVVSGRVVFGWKFIEEPLREAVARTMAGRLVNWSVVPGEPTGAGLGGALEVAVEQYLSTFTAATKAVA